MATNEQVKSFISTLGKLAAKVCKERGYSDISAKVCVCQAALETGWGTSSLMVKANAYFGIKATGWKGKVYNSQTNEVYNGTTVNINANFRAYDTLEASVRDYFDLISGSRYAASLKAKSVLECITAIKNGGYATDPNYINSIMSIYNSYKTYIDEATKLPVDVVITYQSFFGRWGAEIKSNTSSYSGDCDHPISGIRAKSTVGKVYVQSRLINGKELGLASAYVKDGGVGTGYSGQMYNGIDAFRVKVEGIDPSKVRYRGHWDGKAGKWGRWYTAVEFGWAGLAGHLLDAVQIQIIE